MSSQPQNAPQQPSWLKLRPDRWRGDLLRVVLRVTAVLGGIVYVPSVLLALKAGLVGIVVLDTVAIGGVIALATIERIPLKVRAFCTSVIFYMLGAGLMVAVGSISQIYLFGSSLFATLLLSLRWGLGTVVVNAITMLVIGAFGIMAPDMVGPHWIMDMRGWTLITANFVFVNVSLVLAFGAVIAALEKSNGSLKDEVTRRARSEESLLEGRALLRIAGRTARLGGWRLSAKDRQLVWSEEVRELHELPEGAAPTFEEALRFYEPDSASGSSSRSNAVSTREPLSTSRPSSSPRVPPGSGFACWETPRACPMAPSLTSPARCRTSRPRRPPRRATRSSSRSCCRCRRWKRWAASRAGWLTTSTTCSP